MRSDGEIQADVRKEIDEYADLGRFFIQLSVDRGIVVLSGAVSTEEQRRQAGDAADAVRGVRTVRNELRVVSDVAAPPAMER